MIAGRRPEAEIAFPFCVSKTRSTSHEIDFPNLVRSNILKDRTCGRQLRRFELRSTTTDSQIFAVNKKICPH